MSFLDRLLGKNRQNTSGRDGNEINEPAGFEKILTSQLAAYWLETGKRKYKEEYLRRMRMCEVSDETAEKTFSFETDILRRMPRPEMLLPDFIQMGMFSLTERALPEWYTYYETHFDYPFSYVVKLSDEAEWHFWNSHEKDLSEEVWGEIFALSDKNRKLFIPFAMNLVNNLGWSVKQVNAFSFNEQGMLDYYRWGRSTTRAAKLPWGMKRVH